MIEREEFGEPLSDPRPISVVTAWRSENRVKLPRKRRQPPYRRICDCGTVATSVFGERHGAEMLYEASPFPEDRVDGGSMRC